MSTRITSSDGAEIPSLTRTFRIGCVLIAVEGLCFLVFSYLQAQRFNLNMDLAQFGQAWYKIAHLDFNSIVTFKGRPFYADHGDFFFYLFAPLWYVWPHVVTLMWIQDLFAIIAQVVALRWLHEYLAAKPLAPRNAKSLTVFASLGVCLLVFDPWIFWAIANDFHTEVFAAAFLVLAARAFYHQYRIAWLWSLCVILNGNVSASYLVGLAISLVLAKRKFWRPALGLLALTGAFTILATVVKADRGSSYRGYAYLGGIGSTTPNSMLEVLRLIASHPLRALNNLFGYRLALFTTLSVPGVVGVVSPWAFGVVFICIIEAGFLSWPVLLPQYSFQNFVVLIFLPVGTVMVLSDLHASHRKSLVGLARAVVAMQFVWTFGWFIVWTPEGSRRWNSIPERSAQVLRESFDRIPRTDQVVTSQSVVGGFSAREYLWLIWSDEKAQLDLPVKTPTVWFVITPNLGINLQTPSTAYRMISKLLTVPGMTLVEQRFGIYILKWKVPEGFGDRLSISYPSQPVVPALLNSADGWHSNYGSGNRGYVLSGLYQIIDRPQNFRYSVTLQSDGPLIFEVWDTTSEVLLVRRNFTTTGNRIQKIELIGRASKIHGQNIWNGIWPFQSQVERPVHEGDALELRIFNEGGTKYKIQSVDFETEFSSH